MATRRSRSAFAAALFGVIALVDSVLGPLLANLGIVRPATGYYLFLLGGVEALLGAALALVGFARTRSGSRLTGRGLAWLGFSASVAVLAAFVQAGAGGRGLPSLADVTTSPDDPPAFDLALADPANAGRDMAYPEESAAAQRAAYPDLAPIEVAAPPGDVLERARRAAESLDWEVSEVRPPQQEDGEGRIEARQASGVFRFVDDVVVRVRPAAGGSVVDVRSKSRRPGGDRGANAARIRAFRAALGE